MASGPCSRWNGIAATMPIFSERLPTTFIFGLVQTLSGRLPQSVLWFGVRGTTPDLMVWNIPPCRPIVNSPLFFGQKLEGFNAGCILPILPILMVMGVCPMFISRNKKTPAYHKTKNAGAFGPLPDTYQLLVRISG